MLYQNYQIEKDMDELRKDVLASGGHYSDQELKEKLKAVDNLESDQKMFMIMTAMIPLVVAGGAMGAGPVIALTAILGTITAASSLFWDISMERNGMRGSITSTILFRQMQTENMHGMFRKAGGE